MWKRKKVENDRVSGKRQTQSRFIHLGNIIVVVVEIRKTIVKIMKIMLEKLELKSIE